MMAPRICYNDYFLIVKLYFCKNILFTIVTKDHVEKLNDDDNEVIVEFTKCIRQCTVVSTSNYYWRVLSNVQRMQAETMNRRQIDFDEFDVKPAFDFTLNIAFHRLLTKVMFPSAEGFDTKIEIGTNGTYVQESVFDSIDFQESYAVMTRKLLSALFSKETLAKHSLSGKQGNDINKPARPQLDMKIVDDIVDIVRKRTNRSEQDIRKVISTMCSHEHTKMLKRKTSET